MHPRVLLVGFSERNKYFGSFFYATVHKLRNGLVRAGSHVVWFSDRDIADYSAPLRYRPLGAWAANAKLLQLVETIEPDIICLMHTTLISDETLARVRHQYPSTRIIAIFLDPLTDDLFGQRFRHVAATSDLAFATTAGATLARYANSGAVGFIPNPVDLSVERACAFAAPDHEYDFFFAGKPKGREAVLLDVQQRLPNRRVGLFLQTGKAPMPLAGASYTRALERSRIAVAACFDSDWKWYASDRIAQHLGAGCLVAHQAIGDMETLYGRDTLLIYKDADDLAAQGDALLTDDRWRERARAGQARALAMSDTKIVARYLLDRATGTQSFDWPAWTAEFYPKTADG
jgi:hypothetical protein